MIYAERDRFPLQLMLRPLGVSKSGYFSWLKSKLHRSDRQQKGDQLDHLIRILFIENHKNFGSPRLHRLLKNLGIKVSLDTVEARMREMGLIALGESKQKVRSLNHFTISQRVRTCSTETLLSILRAPRG